MKKIVAGRSVKLSLTTFLISKFESCIGFGFISKKAQLCFDFF